MATTPDTISDRINRRITDLNLENIEVAAACRVSEQSVRNWRESAENMRAKHLRPLAGALRCSVAYLLCLTDSVEAAA